MVVEKGEAVINGKSSDLMEKIIMYPQSPLDEGTRLAKPTLPIVLTAFVGREQMVKDICTLLCCSQVRLLTLTGMAGVGKTRLGVEVATKLTNDFVDGVCFVPLATIRDSELVIPTIARQLGVQETGMQSIFEQAKVALQEKHVLLVLDNFEQVISGAFQVEELLVACTSLKVIVTSREVLHLQAETVYPVPPLPLPDLDQIPEHMPECETLSQYPAVKLFVGRVQTISPSFAMTPTNARDIVKICRRLDGLPLALELAAIRMRLLPLSALLTRLSSGRLRVLKQTLRNTIQWSYDLLTAEEKQLFRQLSVFVGGFTAEGAETIAQLNDDEKPSGTVSVLDRVESLLDKSLLLQVGQEGEEPRLSMLETIREYGLECLQGSGEAQVCQQAHAKYYLSLAQEAEPHLRGAQQALWWKRLELEQENLRAALTWLIEQGEGEQALCLCEALWRFWNQRGYWSEGRRWLEAALALPQAQGRTLKRANALLGAAELTYRLGSPKALSYAEECLSIYRELGDKRGLALLLSGLGLGMFVEKGIGAARPLLKEGLDLARELGDRWVLAYSLQNQGDVMCRNGDFKCAYVSLKESVMLYRELQDKQSLSRRLLELGWVSPMTQAAALARESLELAQELGNEPDIARAFYVSAVIQSLQHDGEQAVRLLEKSLSLFRKQGDKLYIGLTLLTLGGIVLHQGDLSQAEIYAQKSLTHLRVIGGPYRTALALRLLGDVRRMQGDLTQAWNDYIEGLSLVLETGNRFGMGRNLIGLARVAAIEGQLEQAACLFGAAELLFNPRVDFHPDMDPFECTDYEHVVESVRTQLGTKAFTAAWNMGHNMTPAQVIANLKPRPLPSDPPTGRPSTPVETPPNPAGLTRSEMKVLCLLAREGLTDAQIAEQLVVSIVTVRSHLRLIYSKLGVHSRSAAILYAIEHGLV